MKQTNVAIRRINIILDALIQISIFFLLCVLLAFSIFLIYFINNRAEVNAKITIFLESYFEKKLNLRLKIEDFDIVRGYGDLFLSAKNITLEDDFGIYNIDIKDIRLSFDYYKLLALKINLNAAIKQVDFTLNQIVLSDKNKQKSPNFAFYFRFFDIDIETVNIDIEGEKFALNGAMMRFENFEIDDLNLKASLSGNLLQEEKNAFFSGNCKLDDGNFDCLSEAFLIKNSSLKKIVSLLKKHSIIPTNYFIFVNGEFEYINFAINSAKEGYNIDINFDAKALDFISPFLFEKKEIHVSETMFRSSYNSGNFTSSFKFFFENEKQAFGEAILSKEKQLSIDVQAENLTINDIEKYWPKRYLPEVKDWISGSIYDAEVPKVLFHMQDPHISKQDFLVQIWFNNGRFQYSDALPDIQNANGIVNVFLDDVEILIESLTAKNLSAKNSRAIYNTLNGSLLLDINAKGELADFINFFLLNDKVNNIFSQHFKGKTNANLKFRTVLHGKPESIFKNADYFGIAEVENLWTPVIRGKKNQVVNINVKKEMNSDLTNLIFSEKVYFTPSCSSNPLQNASIGFFIDLKSGSFGLPNILFENDEEKIIGGINFNYNQPKIFTDLTFPSIKFCGNDFALSLENIKKKIEIIGSSIELKTLQNTDLDHFIKQFSGSGNNPNEDLKNFLLDIKTYDALIQLKEAYFYNNFNLKNLNLRYAKNYEFDVKSDLINGFRNKEELKLNIKNIGGFSNAFHIKENQFKGGELDIKAEVASENELADGTILMTNYELKAGELDFSSKKLQGKFTEKNNLFHISDLKFSNLIHTVIFNGDINLNDFTINAEVYYTPSTFDVYNQVIDLYPPASNAFHAITFNTFKNGIITLNYDVSGSVFQPEVSFRTTSTAKKIIITGGKIVLIIIGINIIVLPILAFVL